MVMDIRAQLSMSFNLDKCIGCHTCSVSCKNVWTSRQGAEYMWWNNVETKPGAGYPLTWEDQNRYRGGWEVADGNLRLKLIKGNKLRTLASIFFQPNLPTIDDYYEPFTYDYQNLFNAPAGDDQPAPWRPRAVALESLDDRRYRWTVIGLCAVLAAASACGGATVAAPEPPTSR